MRGDTALPDAAVGVGSGDAGSGDAGSGDAVWGGGDLLRARAGSLRACACWGDAAVWAEGFGDSAFWGEGFGDAAFWGEGFGDAAGLLLRVRVGLGVTGWGVGSLGSCAFFGAGHDSSWCSAWSLARFFVSSVSSVRQNVSFDMVKQKK
jgi:hypothetical protein